MSEGISSRWLGSFGVQIEAPSRQLLVDRELEVDSDVTKQSSATPNPNATELTWICSQFHQESRGLSRKPALPQGC